MIKENIIFFKQLLMCLQKISIEIGKYLIYFMICMILVINQFIKIHYKEQYNRIHFLYLLYCEMAQLLTRFIEYTPLKIKPNTLKNIISQAHDNIRKTNKEKITFTISSSNQKNQFHKNLIFYVEFGNIQGKNKIRQMIQLDTQSLKVKFSYQKDYIDEKFKNTDRLIDDILNYFDSLSTFHFPMRIYKQLDSIKIQFIYFQNKSQRILQKNFKKSLQTFIEIDSILCQQFGKHKKTVSKQNKTYNNEVNEKYQNKFSIEQKILHLKILLSKSKNKNDIDSFSKINLNFLQFYDKSSSKLEKIMAEYYDNREDIRDYYIQTLKKVNAEIKKQKKQTNSILAQCITMINKQKQAPQKLIQKIPHVFKVKCQYYKVITCNNPSQLQKYNFSSCENQILEKQQEENYFQGNKNISKQKIKQVLIMKQNIQNNSLKTQAFINQAKFIYKYRASKCNSFARYLLEPKSNLQEYPQQFYIQKYQKSLQSNINKNYNHKNTGQLIKIMYQVMKGIKFLYEKGLIHRDIKPGNIMLDKKQNPKIIDFEGVIQHYKKDNNNQPEFYNQNLIVRTKGFYIQYQKLQKQVRKKYMERSQYQQHALCDMYSFGKTFQFVNEISQQKLGNNPQHEYIRLMLSDIYDLCIETDPDLRINPNQCLVFLHLLQQKIAQDQRTKDLSKKFESMSIADKRQNN